MLDPNVTHALNQVARDLGQSREVDEVLSTIVASVIHSLPEIDHAGISVTHRDGTIETKIWTDKLVTDFDELQYELRQGPCIDAIDPKIPDDIVRVDHARHEQRWPQYIPQAVKAGLRSQLGLRLYTEDQTVGGLNLYSTSTDVISDDTELLAEMFATHAALALGRVRKETQLMKSMETRALIGQATGMVMERYNLDARRAFDYLIRVSQSSNTKLRDIANHIVANGRVPAANLPDATDQTSN